MGDIAIKIENLSKQYRLGVVGTGTLSHDMKRWWTVNVRRQEDPYLKIGETNDRASKGMSDYVWALKDINLEIKQGDVVGIIGKNGAGKSTLLKILSRVTKPTTGSIDYKGRIASLLEVGTGFHPEMTGRENIYMNGAIMGMTRAEITRKFDEIVAFAGVERYIDTPVKRYSSGMTVRLGFSIAAHLEPDILVVDEVLAVGDTEFQKKAIGKMQDVSKEGGRTVLFVSHNMGAIQKLCKNCVLLNNGSVFDIGETSSVLKTYLYNNVVSQSCIDIPINKGKIAYAKQISIRDFDNNIISEFPIGKAIMVHIELNVVQNLTHFVLGIGISTLSDIAVQTVYTEPSAINKGEYSFDFKLKDIYSQGQYKINLGLSENDQLIQYFEDITSFNVSDITDILNEKKIIRTKGIGIILNPVEVIKTQKTL